MGGGGGGSKRGTWYTSTLRTSMARPLKRRVLPRWQYPRLCGHLRGHPVLLLQWLTKSANFLPENTDREIAFY